MNFICKTSFNSQAGKFYAHNSKIDFYEYQQLTDFEKLHFRQNGFLFSEEQKRQLVGIVFKPFEKIIALNHAISQSKNRYL